VPQSKSRGLSENSGAARFLPLLLPALRTADRAPTATPATSLETLLDPFLHDPPCIGLARAPRLLSAKPAAANAAAVPILLLHACRQSPSPAAQRISSISQQAPDPDVLQEPLSLFAVPLSEPPQQIAPSPDRIP